MSNGFPEPTDVGREVFYRLAAGLCTSCTMVQQLEEVPRARMFHEDYPYRTSSSSAMSRHFEQAAADFLEAELTSADPLIVEIGSNDGALLKTIRDAGVRHLGVDPSAGAAAAATDKGLRVRVGFFDESSASEIRRTEGPANLVFSSNTTSHIAYIDSIFRGVDTLLGPDGVFVIEDRYVGDIIRYNIFDQIYDEHFYLFGVQSVQAMAARFGFELVDVEPQAVHGGSLRYTLARPDRRTPTTRPREMLHAEREQRLGEFSTYERFGADVRAIRDDLVSLLSTVRAKGKRVVGYGATSKSATVTNWANIGTDLVPFVCDSIPEKQGRVTPGSHIPVRPPEAFADPYPDYALLFAWTHAEEIMARERQFAASGGEWILYVPHVRTV